MNKLIYKPVSKSFVVKYPVNEQNEKLFDISVECIGLLRKYLNKTFSVESFYFNCEYDHDEDLCYVKFKYNATEEEIEVVLQGLSDLVFNYQKHIM